MAASLQDMVGTEPSSDFPTLDDVQPCEPSRAMRLAILGLLGGAILVGVIAFFAGRARARKATPER